MRRLKLRFGYDLSKRTKLSKDRHVPYSLYKLKRNMQFMIMKACNHGNDNSELIIYIVFKILLENQTAYEDITGMKTTDSPFYKNARFRQRVRDRSKILSTHTHTHILPN